MSYKINKEMCVGCGACAGVCGANAIVKTADNKFEINPDLCASCGVCAGVCPVGAITSE